MDRPPFVLEGSQDNFGELVLENSRRGPVLVDFWSPRVGPFLRQRDLLVRLAQAYGGRFLLVSIDTDRERGLVADYGVRSLPSCKLFRQGRLVEQVFGLQPEAHYRALIDRHLPVVADGVTATALRAWNQGDGEGAVRILAAESAPTADALTRRLEEDPQDREALFQLAARLLVAGDLEGALAQLGALVEQAPDCGGGAAARALAALLKLLDPDDERIRRYRRSLMNRHS